MKTRFTWIFFFLAACSGSVIQDPHDPGSISDAGPEDTPDATGGTPDGGSLTVGLACTADADCGDSKYHCQPSAPGGYCSYYCTMDSECPTGSVCSPVPYSRISGICMKSCGSDKECRTGYTCSVVYLFPGQTTSPNSSSPVCWEAQDAGP